MSNDLVTKLKIETSEAKAEIKNLRAALAQTQAQCKKLNSEVAKTRGASGYSKIAKGLESVLNVGGQTNGVLGLITGGMGKLAGALGVATTAAELFSETLKVNDNISDEFHKTCDVAKESLDAFLYSFTTGQMSDFITTLKEVRQATEEAFDARDTFETYKTSINMALSNEKAKYQQCLMLSRDRNLSEKDRLKYLHQAEIHHNKIIQQMTLEAKLARITAGKEYKQAMAENGITSKAQQKWVMDHANKGDAQLIADNFISNYNDKVKELTKNVNSQKTVKTRTTVSGRRETYEDYKPGYQKAQQALSAYQAQNAGVLKFYKNVSQMYNKNSEALQMADATIEEANNYETELVAAKQAMDNSYKRIVGSGKGGSKKNAQQQYARAQEQYFEAQMGINNLVKKQESDINFSQRQSDIDLTPGNDWEKRNRQNELEKDKEIAEINKRYDEILQAKVQAEKKIFLSDKNNLTKNFYDSDVYKNIGLDPETIKAKEAEIQAVNSKFIIEAKGSITDLSETISYLQGQLDKGLIPEEDIEKTVKKIKETTKQIETLKKATTPKDYQKGSVNDYAARKSELQTKLSNTTVGSDEYKKIKAELEALTKEEWRINLKAEGLSDLQIGLKEAMQKVEKVQEGFGAFSNVVGSIDGVVSAVDQMKTDMEEGADAWTQFVDVINVATSVLSTISTVMQSVDTILKLLTPATQAAAAADSAAAAQQVANSGMKAAANTTEATTKAVANGTQAGWPGMLIAIPIALAAVIAALASAGSFASGGIVGGSSFSGDKMLAHVNSSEMILTTQHQKALWNAIDSGDFGGGSNGGGQVEFQIKGKNLYGVLQNYDTHKSKM